MQMISILFGSAAFCYAISFALLVRWDSMTTPDRGFWLLASALALLAGTWCYANSARRAKIEDDRKTHHETAVLSALDVLVTEVKGLRNDLKK